MGSHSGLPRSPCFAASLLELRFGGGADGDVPSTHEVVNDLRHAGQEQHVFLSVVTGQCTEICDF